MAKAIFHKNQRVYVKPVGTWANVERVLPQWVKGMDEPLKVFYDVGLGRDFSAQELKAEDKKSSPAHTDEMLENWRVFRARNQWESENIESHPHPGTFPIVQTDEGNWGGWRVPGSEYDRDPDRIEHQARLIAGSPRLLKLMRKTVETVSQNPQHYPDELKEVARLGVLVLREIYDVPEELLEEMPKRASV